MVYNHTEALRPSALAVIKPSPVGDLLATKNYSTKKKINNPALLVPCPS